MKKAAYRKLDRVNKKEKYLTEVKLQNDRNLQHKQKESMADSEIYRRKSKPEQKNMTTFVKTLKCNREVEANHICSCHKSCCCKGVSYHVWRNCSGYTRSFCSGF